MHHRFYLFDNGDIAADVVHPCDHTHDYALNGAELDAALAALVRVIAEQHPTVINDALEHRAATGRDVLRRLRDDFVDAIARDPWFRGHAEGARLALLDALGPARDRG